MPDHLFLTHGKDQNYKSNNKKLIQKVKLYGAAL